MKCVRNISFGDGTTKKCICMVKLMPTQRSWSSTPPPTTVTDRMSLEATMTCKNPDICLRQYS